MYLGRYSSSTGIRPHITTRIALLANKKPEIATKGTNISYQTDSFISYTKNQGSLSRGHDVHFLICQELTIEVMLPLLVNGVRRRVAQIEIEIEIIEAQLKLILNVPNFDQDEVALLYLEHNMNVAIHQMYCSYLSLISQEKDTDISLRKTVSKHMEVVRKLEGRIEEFLEEVAVHQSAIESIIGLSVSDLSGGSSCDDILKVISLLMPFHLLVPRLCESRFMDELLSIVKDYDPANHKQVLLKLMNLLACLKLDKYVLVTLSEVFLGFFMGSQIERSCRSPDEMFRYIENSWILIRNGMSSFGLAEKAENLKVNASTGEHAPAFTLKTWTAYCESWQRPNQVFKNALVPGLRHVVLELRKIETQVTVSLAAYRLWRASDWLNNALSLDGEYVGADESFIFFVIMLCEADMTRLPMILRAMEKYIIQEFKESKVGYLLTRLRTAFDWIADHQVESADVVLLPMKRYNEHETVSPAGVTVEGLAIYAVPTFVESEMRVWANFTGEHSDIATLYPYSIPRSDQLSYFKLPEGYVPVLTPQLQKALHMIKVIGGDYEGSVESVNTVSNYMMFLPIKIEAPKTAPLARLEEIYGDIWGVAGPKVESDMRDRVIAMRKALIRHEALPQCEELPHVVDHTMIEAVNDVFHYFEDINDFFIDARLYKQVTSLK